MRAKYICIDLGKDVPSDFEDKVNLFLGTKPIIEKAYYHDTEYGPSVLFFYDYPELRTSARISRDAIM